MSGNTSRAGKVEHSRQEGDQGEEQQRRMLYWRHGVAIWLLGGKESKCSRTFIRWWLSRLDLMDVMFMYVIALFVVDISVSMVELAFYGLFLGVL